MCALIQTIGQSRRKTVANRRAKNDGGVETVTIAQQGSLVDRDWRRARSVGRFHRGLVIRDKSYCHALWVVLHVTVDYMSHASDRGVHRSDVRQPRHAGGSVSACLHTLGTRRPS
jgi:hypothetical protein